MTAPAAPPVSHPVSHRTGSWLARHAYEALSLLVLLLVAVQTANGQWSSDMWEHVAVVRELSAHPFHPSHPQLALDAPHPGFSPYGVVLGLLGAATGAEPLGVLSVVGVLDVALLLAAFRWLVIETTRNHRALVWALLAVLAFWGPRPFRYSGFYNLNSIGFVAPFPSTATTAVALAVLAAGLRYARGGGRRWLVVVGVGSAFVALSHPLSAPWLASALVVVALTGRLERARVAGWALAALGALGLCLVWPYYSFAELVADSGGLDDLNETMYSGVVPRVLPLLLGVPLLVWRLRRDRRDVLGLWFLSAGLVYVVGAIVDNSSLGRTLAFIVLVLAIAIGDGAGRLEVSGTAWQRRAAV
ncbi:MAG TPA: hypothetical protein VFI44_06650, partial [Ornithinibacter sp.]|nr:hypothetical protein [Ornithinibacter sp.]